MRRNGETFALECSGAATANGRPIVDGDAHVMITALDDRDIRDSVGLAILPITKGRLLLHTTASWRAPVLEAGELNGAEWRSLATTPLKPDRGTLAIQIDEALLRIQRRTYGVCLGTLKPISKARLRARPWAKYGIEYARMVEEGLIQPGEPPVEEDEEDSWSFD